MVQVELNDMYINIGVNNGSENNFQSIFNTFTAIVDLSRFNNSCLKSRQRRP